MKPLRSFTSPLQRQANEAVRVTSIRADTIKNSKNEWHQAPIVRVVASSGLAGEQGEDQVPVLPARGGRGVRGRGGRAGRGGRYSGQRGRRPPRTS